ncbi:MAG: AmmeMemoRadiSam system radical SAM enzyme [bacterium]
MVTMKQAMLWEARDGVVACRLCAHRCKISDGKRGLCDVRLNSGGALQSLVYGKLISSAVDPIEKKPLYNFLPGTRSYSIATAGCNFRCDFCQNWQISQAVRDGAGIPGEDWTPEQVVAEAGSSGCASISYTYTEPTIFFEFAYDTALVAAREGLRNVFVTNGYQTPETVEKMAGVIDAANVDLKSFSDEFYKRLCGARLAPVLEAIRLMHEKGIFLEITTLVIPGENDRPEELGQIAEFIAGVSPEIPWHVSRYHPDYRHRGSSWTSSEGVIRAAEIGLASGLKYVYAGNLPAGRFENTYCPACGAELIARSGFSSWKTGLARAAGATGGACCGTCGARVNVVL